MIAVFLMNVSCIFGPSTRKVVSYRYNTVYFSNRDTFDVGELPPTWKKIDVDAYAIAFHNDMLGTTISVDAWCGPAFEDSPLPTLTSQMMAGVADYKIESTEEFMLDRRGALRTVATGRVDGVYLTYDIVVLKKNDCNFDLMLISPMGNYLAARPDFENFFYAFHYE